MKIKLLTVMAVVLTAILITGCGNSASAEPSQDLIKYAVECDAQDKVSQKFGHLGTVTSKVNEYRTCNKSEGMLNGQKMITYQYYAKAIVRLKTAQGGDMSEKFDCGGAIRFIKNGDSWERVIAIWGK